MIGDFDVLNPRKIGDVQPEGLRLDAGGLHIIFNRLRNGCEQIFVSGAARAREHGGFFPLRSALITCKEAYLRSLETLQGRGDHLIGFAADELVAGLDYDVVETGAVESFGNSGP